MGAIGKIAGGAIGGAIGFFAGGPMGAAAGAGLGASLMGGLGGKVGGGSKPPPVINKTPANQQIANQIQPLNFAQIMDEISGDQLTLMRGTDGKIGLRFGNSRNRVPLDGPIETGNVNTSLPAVRQIRGRGITEEAAAVIVLTQAMRQLTGTIEQMEKANPLFIEQNKGLLDSFRGAQQMALDKGFDIRQQGIDQKLAKMGLLNSSTALGVQVSLMREKVEAQSTANLEYATLAQNLKQQSLENIHKRGDQMANTANIELGRFAAETSNQLQLRGQDMQADLATQQLDQQRALSESQLQLARNDQLIGAELGRRELQANQQNRLASVGLDLINNTNNQAIGARAADNQALSDANRWQYQRYALKSNPWQEAAMTGIGSIIGAAGKGIGKAGVGYLTKGIGGAGDKESAIGMLGNSRTGR